MARQHVERALLVVEAQAMHVPALAVAAGEYRDRGGGIVVECRRRQDLHAVRTPIEILARVGKGDAGVFEEDTIGCDAGARGAFGHRLPHRRLHVLARHQLGTTHARDMLGIAAAARGRRRVQIDQVFADELLDAEMHGRSAPFARQ